MRRSAMLRGGPGSGRSGLELELPWRACTGRSRTGPWLMPTAGPTGRAFPSHQGPSSANAGRCCSTSLTRRENSIVAGCRRSHGGQRRATAKRPNECCAGPSANLPMLSGCSRRPAVRPLGNPRLRAAESSDGPPPGTNRGTRKESLPAAGVAVPSRNQPGSAETPRPPLWARCCRRHHHRCRRHAGQHRPLRDGRRLPALLPRWPPLPPPPPPQRERTVPPRQRCSSGARRTQALPTRNRELPSRL